MEIEVRQPEGFYAKAFVQSLSENGVTVAYERDWKPNETVGFDRCRALMSDKPPTADFKVGDTIEVYFRKGNQPAEFWQKAKLRDIKVKQKIVFTDSNHFCLGRVCSH